MNFLATTDEVGGVEPLAPTRTSRSRLRVDFCDCGVIPPASGAPLQCIGVRHFRRMLMDFVACPVAYARRASCAAFMFQRPTVISIYRNQKV